MFKKTMILVVGIVLGWSFTVWGADTKIIPLPELNKPEQAVKINDGRLYLNEGPAILIYSLKDFKLIKKFGKKGEGPQEFVVTDRMGPPGWLTFDVQSKNILAKSMGKLSWFTKEGAFIKEVKSPSPFTYDALILDDKVALQKVEMKDGVRKLVLEVYDQSLKSIKKLKEVEDGFQMGKGLMVLKDNPVQQTYKDQLFVAWERDITVDVLDKNLKTLYTIKHPQKREKVDQELKDQIVNWFKTSPKTKDAYNFLKPIRFPEYFPAVQRLSVTGDKVYVITFSSNKVKDAEMTDVLVFDIKGKFLKKVVLPLQMMTPLEPYPYTIYKGNFYQVIENLDEEEWNLHITKIK